MAENPSSRPGGNKPGGGGNRPAGGGGGNRPAGGGGGNRPGGYRPPGAPGGGSRPPGSRPPGSRPPGGRPIPQRGRQVQAEHRINDLIWGVTEMRLVGDNLEELTTLLGKPIEAGVFDVATLRQWAEEAELDLVEITPNAVPPVARIIDYNKFLYQKKKREKEIKANTSKQQLKEIRFGPETGDHDYEFKLRHAKTFLGEGNKVKAYVQFRGRAIVFKDRGELLLLRFLKELEEVGTPESLPKLEGKKMIVIITPKKSGGKK